MSSLSNSEIRDAWIAAPLALREDGSMAVGRVDGEIMRVVEGKIDCTRVDSRGVCDVPPDKMTYFISFRTQWFR